MAHLNRAATAVDSNGSSVLPPDSLAAGHPSDARAAAPSAAPHAAADAVPWAALEVSDLRTQPGAAAAPWLPSGGSKHAVLGGSSGSGDGSSGGGGGGGGLRDWSWLFFLGDLDGRVVALCAFAALMAIDTTALRATLPSYVKGYGGSTAGVGAAYSAFALARLAANIPAGALGDRAGRRLLLVGGPLLMAAGELGCGAAPGLPAFLAARAVLGAGAAVEWAGLELALADISVPATRARTLGVNQTVGRLGALVGPSLGGALADAAGLRAPFFLAAFAAAAAAAVAFAALPETHRGRVGFGTQGSGFTAHSQQSEALAPLLPPGGDGGGGNADSDDRRPGQRHPASPKAAAAAAAAAAEEGASAEPTLPQLPKPGWVAILGSRDFCAVAAVHAAVMVAVNGGKGLLLPLLARSAFRLSHAAIGLMIGGIALVALVGTLPSAALADRAGRRAAILPAVAAEAAALLLMAAAGNVFTLGAAAALYGVGNALRGAGLVAYALDVLPPGSRGVGVGLLRCGGDLGVLAGPPLLGALADAASARVALVAVAVVLAAAGIGFAAFAREAAHLRLGQGE